MGRGIKVKTENIQEEEGRVKVTAKTYRDGKGVKATAKNIEEWEGGGQSNS